MFTEMWCNFHTSKDFQSCVENLKTWYIKFSRESSRFKGDMRCINLMLNTKLDAIIQHSHKIE